MKILKQYKTIAVRATELLYACEDDNVRPDFTNLDLFINEAIEKFTESTPDGVAKIVNIETQRVTKEFDERIKRVYITFEYELA